MHVNMLGRSDLRTNRLTICWKEKQSLKPGTTRMTALVKGSVSRGHAPPPPEARDNLCKGQCRRTLWSKFHSLFLRVRIDFQKGASFKSFKQLPAVL